MPQGASASSSAGRIGRPPHGGFSFWTGWCWWLRWPLCVARCSSRSGTASRATSSPRQSAPATPRRAPGRLGISERLWMQLGSAALFGDRRRHVDPDAVNAACFDEEAGASGPRVPFRSRFVASGRCRGREPANLATHRNGSSRTSQTSLRVCVEHPHAGVRLVGGPIRTSPSP